MLTHPRISVSAMSSVRWSFDEDLALWRELGLRWAGLIGAKLGDEIEDRIAALADAGIRISTVIVPRFDLGAPASWAATHAAHRRWIDAVAKYDGWSLYLTPGRPTGDPWEELLERLAAAAAPSVAYARDRGVRLAFEPSKRTEVSFVNNLADAVDVAERTGLEIVADIGNFWMERDLRATLLRAAPHIGLVQLTDVSIGTVLSPDDPPSGGRVPFGEGDLPVTRILADIKDTGYAGPLELELVGPLGDSEGYGPVIRRGVCAAAPMLAAAGL
jgi:sugar phosphate isomerase/epimerase